MVSGEIVGAATGLGKLGLPLNHHPIRTRLRAFLVLGRISNLPTVWSNCLAGWWLGGGGAVAEWMLLSVGASFLYVGGMYLNDAFDVDFDRQHRLERPIPAGIVPLKIVWFFGFLWLVLGIFLLVLVGGAGLFLTVALASCIFLYDAVHKAITLAPVLMAGCRLLLYLVAASAGEAGVTGLAVWSAIALGCYVTGLSYLARRESTRESFVNWPVALLAVPIVLALLVNDGEFRWRGLLISLGLGLWIWYALRSTYGAGARNIGRTVAALLAGIVLVDWLAVADMGWPESLVFGLLFVIALGMQRFVPAT